MLRLTSPIALTRFCSRFLVYPGILLSRSLLFSCRKGSERVGRSAHIRTARAVEQIVREAVPNRPITIVGSALMSTVALVEIMMTAER